MRKSNLLPILIFLVISFFYASPVLENISYWGHRDWDQAIFWNAVPRETILRYKQFPLWNPYVNGGNPMLGHPDSTFLSPFFIFVLFLGPIIGLKIQIIMHIFIGLTGMFFLSRYLNLSKNSSYLSSFIFMLNSTYALHLSEGHAEWVAMAFVPWGFLYYLKSLSNPKQTLGTIFFLSLMILKGIYIFSFFIAFLSIYSIFKFIQTKKILPIKILFIILTGTFLLCAIKLFPVIEFIRENQRVYYGSPTASTNPGELLKFLFSRNQAGINRSEGGFHEYGAYLGVIPLLLFFIGILTRLKKNWPLILTGFFSFIIVMGSKFPIDLWKFLQYFPVYKSLTTPSRNIFCFVFSFALISGFGLSYLEKLLSKKPWHKLLSLFIVLFVLFDFWHVSSPIFKAPFQIAPIKIKRNNIFHRAEAIMGFPKHELMRSTYYLSLLNNRGTLYGYGKLYIKKGDVQTISEPNYRGEAYLATSRTPISIHYFSPNKIVIDIKTKEPDTLVINQNYYTGWKVFKNGRIKQAQSFNGLIATSIEPNDQQITFFYMPLSFIFGIFVSLGFILFIVRYLIIPKHKKHQ